MTRRLGQDRGIRRGVRRLFRLPLQRRDLARADADEELDMFVDERVDHLMKRGMSRDEARAEAIRRLGVPLTDARDSLRQSAERREARRRLREMTDDLAHDVRYAARGLARRPGFTAAAVLCLAIGIGANATMFGVVDALLLRPAAGVRDPGSLLWIAAQSVDPLAGVPETGGVTYPDYLAFSRSSALAGAAAYAYNERSFGRGAAERHVQVLTVTHTFLPLLGVEPAVGRFFVADDDRAGAAPVVVLGNAFWNAQFAGATDVIGRTVRIGTRLYTVIGVAPAEFNGVERSRVDIYLPLAAGPSDFWDLYLPSSPGQSDLAGLLTDAPWLTVLARVKPGVSVQRLRAEFQALYQQVHASDSWGPTTILVAPPTAKVAMHDREQQQNASVSVWLGGVTIIVLLIACVNVASLLLTRAVRRRREIAVRVAMGVGRFRLARMLIMEGLLLAIAGGMAGLIVAEVGQGLFRATLLSDVALPPTIFDVRVLGATLAATVFTALACGVAAVIRAMRPDLVTTLKAGERDGPEGRGHLLSGLLVGQVALTLALLMGAGLFVRSVRNLETLDLGFDVEHVLRAWVAGSFRDTGPVRRARFLEDLIAGIHRLPAVRGVALASGGPFAGGTYRRIAIRGQPAEKGTPPQMTAVTPEFFATLGIALEHGRLFTDADRAGTERVAIVNANMARHYWPAGDALGKCIKVGGDSMPCTTVVGIVESTRQGNTRGQLVQNEPPARAYYIPYAQEDSAMQNARFASPAVYVRTAGDAERLVPDVRRLMETVAPELTYPDVVAFSTAIAPQFRPWRLGATMFGLFGGIALLLAMVGLYGVLAFRVSQRTHEIGVRMALGAGGRDVQRLVIAQGLRLCVLGIAMGLALTLAARRALSALLYGVSPMDPAVLAVTAAIVVLVSLCASYMPARRAARVDPMEALREL